MGVLSDKTGHVIGIRTEVSFRNKELIELCDEGILTAKDLDKALRILRNKPCVLPAVALAVVVCAVG